MYTSIQQNDKLYVLWHSFWANRLSYFINNCHVKFFKRLTVIFVVVVQYFLNCTIQNRWIHWLTSLCCFNHGFSIEHKIMYCSWEIAFNNDVGAKRRFQAMYTDIEPLIIQINSKVEILLLEL